MDGERESWKSVLSAPLDDDDDDDDAKADVNFSVKVFNSLNTQSYFQQKLFSR